MSQQSLAVQDVQAAPAPLAVPSAGGGSSAGTNDEFIVRDEDRDSLYVLPLGILPLETPSLRRTRLIKNVRLDSVVEFFGDCQTGSGQRSVDDVAVSMNWSANDQHADMKVLRKLAPLPSYDVYSLRIFFRDLGIAVDDTHGLKLSPDGVKALNGYMIQFTYPLIREVFGDSGDGGKAQSFEDIVRLFLNPDNKRAKSNLQVMAEKLDIDLADVPRFLEDYADIFLSLAYYRKCLDGIEPIIGELLDSIDEIRENRQLSSDINLINVCALIESTINGQMAAITGRLENFERSTADMWTNISAARFRQVRTLIEGYHTTIGGVLCALSVKMNGWAMLFPNPSVGGPVKRAEFILSEMRQGINRIHHIEDSAPMLARLAN